MATSSVLEQFARMRFESRFRYVAYVLWSLFLICLALGAFVAAYSGDTLSLSNGEFRLFAIAFGVYILSTYVMFPIIENIDFYAPTRMKNQFEFCEWVFRFTSYFGTGHMAKGSFTMYNIEYVFVTILGLPIIPLRCQAGAVPQLRRSDRMYWRWYEVVYIYLRDWSMAFLLISASMIISRYWLY